MIGLEIRPVKDATVLVIDPREVVRWGLRTVLASQSWIARCDSASDAAQALAAAERLDPAVAIAGSAWTTSHRDCLAQLAAMRPAMRLLVLTPGAAGAASERLPASPRISEHASAREIVDAVRTLLAAEPPALALAAVAPPGLSEREAQVLALMTQGLTNREIGATLHLSVDTVKYHAMRLYRKFGVRNRAAAVCHGAELGFVGATHAAT